MKISEPKRWWFPVALLAALICALLVYALRTVVPALFNDDSAYGAFVFLGMVAYIGSMTFPTGLFAIFVWSTAAFQTGSMSAMVGSGWILYMVLIVVGMVRKSRILFIILIVLLLANIVGCQLPHLTRAFDIGD